MQERKHYFKTVVLVLSLLLGSVVQISAQATPLCQALFTMTPSSSVVRCASNQEAITFAAVLDPTSSMIDNYTFRLYREDNTLVQAEEQNYTGRFTIDASVLNQVGRNGRAEITATSSCDTTSPVTQSVAINIHPEVKIQSLFVNSINDDVAVRLGEPVVLEMTAVENGNPERFLCSINNDIWELGSVYIDYPVNPKTYEVLLTDESGVCSDKRLVNVVAVNPLPNAVISPENPNYAQYEEESLAAGKPTWISVIGDWKVYNRYGQEVFSQESTAEMPTVIWAGQDNDENALPAGSYFYIYTTPKGDAERGTVEVIK